MSGATPNATGSAGARSGPPVQRTAGAASALSIRGLRERLGDLWRSRELLRQFIAKELKVRYKNSALGFFWSLLTPVLMTMVFTVIFAFVIRIDVVDFAAFFIAGYLAWMFFQNAVQGSIQAIVGNGSLIKKVWFPREILPISVVVSQLVHFLLALVAVSPYLIWTRGWGMVAHLPVIIFGIVLLTLFTMGVAMLFAGANVTFRDLQELIVVIFMIWFYASPIIYPFAFVATADNSAARVAEYVLSYNPMTWFIRLLRQSIYGSVVANPAYDPDCLGTGCPSLFLTTSQSWPSPELLVGTTVTAVLAFIIGYAMFQRFSVNFAKEV